MRRPIVVIGAVLLFVACRGSGPVAPSEPAAPARAPTSTVVESAETLAAIQATLDRKRPMAARCLSTAIEAGQLPKHSRGAVTLGFVVVPVAGAGRANQVKVVKTSLSAELLGPCLIELVEKLQFPEVQAPLEWSYTYGFEAT